MDIGAKQVRVRVYGTTCKLELQKFKFRVDLDWPSGAPWLGFKGCRTACGEAKFPGSTCPDNVKYPLAGILEVIVGGGGNLGFVHLALIRYRFNEIARA